MCKISKATVLRAIDRSKGREGIEGRLPLANVNEIVVSTRFHGKTYIQKIPLSSLCESYGRSLHAVKSAYAESL